MVGEDGFEPSKALPADLQSVPFGHSGIPPYEIQLQSWWTDSNPRPADYKSAALPTELHQRDTSLNIIADDTPFVNTLHHIFLFFYTKIDTYPPNCNTAAYHAVLDTMLFL